ncbi:alpha/beta hydrolase [uncultured Klebsiella sp.]|uniref:alpha/beta hydrolase n=1 Tax=uncultured Klebsiella sp. TaxID=284011 RepID=UPI001159A526|nr:alpha/beta hydrolase [uncultured Klebsiella sp.]
MSRRKKSARQAILWIPGGGFRGVDKNMMVAEVQYLVEAGYIVASMYYRGSHQAHYPEQLKDVKTVLRFLRAHAGEYDIDPQYIGVMGRSAGGHLSLMAAMNTESYDTDEWAGFSSKVQAAYDLFGPADIVTLMENDEIQMRNPGHRWKKIEDTHAGALLGGDPAIMKERAKEACVKYFINHEMAPVLIMHGDNDPLVPLTISEDIYNDICRAGLEYRVDFYVVKNGGHGTPEFFQPETQQISLGFFNRQLRAK